MKNVRQSAANQPDRIRVLLVDDHALFREGIGAILQEVPDIQVVGQASNGREAVELAATLEPDVILLDVTMPLLNGAEAARRILAGNGHARILALSMHDELEYVEQLLEAGAAGYLRKGSSSEALLEAVRRVAGGEAYLDGAIAEAVLKEHARLLAASKTASPLTPRQVEVLQLIAEGASTKEIAFQLHVSGKTVETLRRQIMSRLDTHTIAGLTRYALRHGLTSP